MYKNFLSDRSYENNRNVKKVEKALKYELRRCEVEAVDKITEDLADVARPHNSKILYWHVNKLRRSSQSGMSQLKIGMEESQLVIRKELKRDWWNILRMC